MEPSTRSVSILLPKTNTHVQIEARVAGTAVTAADSQGDKRISGAGDPFSFSTISAAIDSISQELHETFEKIGPTKGTVKFGIEVGVESGKLTALLVKGSGKANLEITLEWAR